MDCLYCQFWLNLLKSILLKSFTVFVENLFRIPFFVVELSLLICENQTYHFQRWLILWFLLFVNTKSTQVGDGDDLLHIGILMTVSKLITRVFKFGFYMLKLKTSNKRKFWNEELKKCNMSFISFMKDRSFSQEGLQLPSSYHFLFDILNSNTIFQILLLNLLGILSFTYDINPPSSFLRKTGSLKISHLFQFVIIDKQNFLIELILRYLTITILD